MKMKMLIGAASLLILLFLLQGCGFGSNSGTEEMDSPPAEEESTAEGDMLSEGATNSEATAEEGSAGKDEGQEEEKETVERELYLINEDGLVVPHTFSLPKEEGVLRQSLEYLVHDGPITSMLPNGLQAVLPPGTEVDVHLTEEGVAVADFSPEFKDYDPKHEQAMLEAITWTLTQFENVEEVKFQINGYEQETMPAKDTPIGKAYSRKNGINLENGNVSDIVQSESVTLYFLSQTADETYFVPVTRRVEAEEESSHLDIAMEELLKGPAANSSLYGVVREGTTLEEQVDVEGETASFVFNEELLSEQEGTAVSEEAVRAITLTATEAEGIKNVSLQVKGADDIMAVSGETMNEPIARPETINGSQSSR